MNTVILKWNPAFSSYTMSRFLNDLEKCALANEDVTGMNWSIWEADKVHKGDVFYMLKVGYGQTGIVARGVLTSEPYAGEDWSWRDRPTKYCNLKFEIMINPDAFPLLNSAQLGRAIPDFEWTGGHSGAVLSEEQSTTLEQLWQQYMLSQTEYFNKASDQNLFLQSPPLHAGQVPYNIEIDEDYDSKYIEIKGRAGGIETRIRVFNYYRILGKFGVRSWRALQQLIFQRYPTIEDMRQLCADLFKGQIDFRVFFYKSKSEELEEDED